MSAGSIADVNDLPFPRNAMTAAQSSRMLVLGSGPAGLSAAIYGARAGLAPIVIQGLQPGGQLTITIDVENYPGFREVVQSPWLMEEMRAQAEHVGAQMVWDTIVEVDLSARPFRLAGDTGTIYVGDTLVIATGAQAKWLGVPGVEIVCARRGFCGNACSSTPGIKVLWNSVPKRFVGGAAHEGLIAVEIEDSRTGAVTLVETDGAFVAIGHHPATELFRGTGLLLDDENYIEAKPGTSFTNIPGVFASGDVMDKVYRQAVTAAGTGCMAALDAERFLQTQDLPVARGLISGPIAAAESPARQALRRGSDRPQVEPCLVSPGGEGHLPYIGIICQVSSSEGHK